MSKQAINVLASGHREFLENDYNSNQYAALAKGQSPRILFVTCSDSRVDPWSITRSKPGDLFVVRNAGNLVAASEGNGRVSGDVATLEYAVSVLQVEEVIVCGHSGCGAMTALLAPQTAAHLPAVSEWIHLATPALQDVPPEGGDEDIRLAQLILANVRLQMKNIRSHSFVADAEKSGKLTIRGCVFDIATAQLQLLEEQTGELHPLTSVALDGR